MKNFKILFNNIRGVKSKKVSLEKIVNEERPAVVGIAETHLCEGENFEVEGYISKRSDRKMQGGGGVMVMYHEQIQNMVTVVHETDDQNGFESIWIKLNNDRIVVKVGVIYMPQESETTIKKLESIYKQIENEVKRSIENKESIILMGDFNCKIGIDSNGNDGEVTKGGKILLKMVKKYEMCVLNKEELCSGKWTRILGTEKSAIDFVIMREEDKKYVQYMTIDEKKEKTPLWITNDAERRKIYSDHCTITSEINWRIKLQEEKPPTYMGKKGLEMFEKDLEDSKISEIIRKDEIGNTYEEWSMKVLEIAERNKRSKKKNTKWKSCRLLQKAKKGVIGKLRKEKSMKRKKLLEQRKLLLDEYMLDEMKMKKKNSVDRIIEDIKKDGGVDSETFWKVRARILGKKEEHRYAIRDVDGSLKENPDEIKRVYQQFYDDLLNGRLKNITDNPEREEHVRIMIEAMEMLNSITPKPALELEDVEKMRKALKNNKAGDKRGWKNEYLKSESTEMGKSLHKIFSAVTEMQNPPKEWEEVKIKSVAKKAPHTEMKNKRGLFLTSVVGKAFERIIKERNDESIWEGMSEMQTGGKKKRGPIKEDL